MSKNYNDLNIVNEDGTIFEPPRSDEYAKLLNKYSSCNNRGYKCMFCNKCMHGSYFKPTDDERIIIIEYSQLLEEYIKKHNPSFINTNINLDIIENHTFGIGL